jgi:hypothetical protein
LPEEQAIPDRARGLLGDRGQRAVGLARVAEAVLEDRDADGLALVLAREHRAGRGQARIALARLAVAAPRPLRRRRLLGLAGLAAPALHRPRLRRGRARLRGFLGRLLLEGLGERPEQVGAVVGSDRLARELGELLLEGLGLEGLDGGEGLGGGHGMHPLQVVGFQDVFCF